MDLHITHQDGAPIYLQVINQVKYLISSGRLLPGEELSPIRTLAKQLLINPNTVARAYRELETTGWVVKKRGAGTYVSEMNSPLGREQQRKVIGERILAMLTEGRQMRMPLEDLLALVRDMAREMNYEKRE